MLPIVLDLKISQSRVNARSISGYADDYRVNGRFTAVQVTESANG